MEILALVLGALLLVDLAAFASHDTPARQEKARWAIAAKNLGLSGGVGELKGRLDGVDVELRITEAGTARPSAEAIATPDLETRVSLRQWKEGRSRDGAVRTGDKARDKAWVVRGQVALVRTALGPEARRTLPRVMSLLAPCRVDGHPMRMQAGPGRAQEADRGPADWSPAQAGRQRGRAAVRSPDDGPRLSSLSAGRVPAGPGPRAHPTSR